MKTFRLRLPSNFLVLFAATLLASGVAEAKSAAAVPFSATIAITETIQQVGSPPCILVGAITGEGVATHLGKSALVSRDCINPINETEFSFSSNQLLLTAANGNQVFANYNGIFTTEGTVGVITGGYQIVGGTGRFSKATGAGTVQGLEDMITGKGQVKLTGTISY